MFDRIVGALRRGPVVDLYRLARNPRWELDCWKDFLAFRRSCRELRRDLGGEQRDRGRSCSQTVLVTTYRDDVYEAKLAVFCALSVLAAGGKPIFLVRKGTHTRTLRYLRALRLADVVITSAAHPDAQGRAELQRLRDVDFAGARDWTYRDHPAGVLVLSTLIRTLERVDEGMVRSHRQTLIELATQAIENYETAEVVLSELKPDAVVALETGYVVNGPLVDVALDREIPVVDIASCWRDDAVLLKRLTSAARRRVVAASVDRVEFEALAREPWSREDEERLHRAFEDRYGGRWAMQRTFQSVRSQGDRSLDQMELPDIPVVVIWAHVLWDATFWAGHDLFSTYSDWLVQTVAAATENASVQWLVKSHPANAFRAARGDVSAPVSEADLIARELGSLPDHVRVVPADAPVSSLALYRACDVGVTVRGTPGFEMAALGKPVLTAGTGPFDRLGFTVDSSSPSEYLARLANLPSIPAPTDAQVERAKRYALTLFDQRPFVFRSATQEMRMAAGGSWHPLDRNLVFGPSAGDDVKDLGRWLLESRTPDWLLERDTT